MNTNFRDGFQKTAGVTDSTLAKILARRSMKTLGKGIPKGKAFDSVYDYTKSTKKESIEEVSNILGKEYGSAKAGRAASHRGHVADAQLRYPKNKKPTETAEAMDSKADAVFEKRLKDFKKSELFDTLKQKK